MAVKRIVTNIASPDVAAVRQFYETLFDLSVAMDFGWIATLKADGHAPVLLSIASEGGSGAATPDITIEVDDLDATYDRAKARGHPIEYDLTAEPWGVRRFFVRDPAGKLLNVMTHTG